MQLFDVVQADGLRLIKVSNSQGGEYHSSCPSCGGQDRFIIWNKTNRYFCRRCEKKGDTIQYLRDFHGLSYFAACKHIGIQPKQPDSSKPQAIFEPKPSIMPCSSWKASASAFIQYANRKLFNSSYAVGLFLKRGFNPETMCTYKIGWNPQSLWVLRSTWGIQDESHKKLWLPRGLVLPTFDIDTQEPIKIKIRRDDWFCCDRFPKYVEIPGGMATPCRYGNPMSKPIMIVESEFDAILIQQIAGDLITGMALGGASKRPDLQAHRLLIRAPLLLFSLDVDSAGARAYPWWKTMYPQLKLWLAPVGKSPGEALQKGLDLRRWICCGL